MILAGVVGFALLTIVLTVLCGLAGTGRAKELLGNTETLSGALFWAAVLSLIVTVFLADLVK